MFSPSAASLPRGWCIYVEKKHRGLQAAAPTASNLHPCGCGGDERKVETLPETPRRESWGAPTKTSVFAANEPASKYELEGLTVSRLIMQTCTTPEDGLN